MTINIVDSPPDQLNIIISTYNHISKNDEPKLIYTGCINIHTSFKDALRNIKLSFKEFKEYFYLDIDFDHDWTVRTNS